MANKIYVIVNTKGGVGKSLTSVTVASLLHEAGKKFKLIEIDDNNESLKFSSSDFLTTENTESFKVDQKDDVTADIFFDLMSDPELDYVVDLGGGNDAKVVKMLQGDDRFDITYIIPSLKTKKFIKNADETFELINDAENTIYLLNGYTKEDIEEEFVYFFGSKKFAIKSASQYFDTKRYLSIPDSNAFQFAEDMEMTLLDLAGISREMTEREANDMFFQQADGNRMKYRQLRTQYLQSVEANRTFEEIKSDFKILF